MVRDEADVIEGTLRHMADEVDELIVADNGSTDGTRDILDALAKELPLTVVDDPEPAYYQSQKMSELAATAAAMGAVWVVPFDADELWVASLGRIREVLAAFDPFVTVARAVLFNHFRTAVDTADPDPFRAMVWRERQPGALPKVAFRWRTGAVVHQGNHGVTLPEGGHIRNALTVRHFPYRSAAQMVTKARNGAAAYAATDLPWSEGEHWRSYGQILERHGPAGLEAVFQEHFWYLSPSDSGMIRSPAPYLRWRQ